MKKIEKPLILQLLLGLILILIGSAYTLLTDDFYKSITELLGYKLTWIILISLFLSLIYSIIYLRSNSEYHFTDEPSSKKKSKTKESARQREMIMLNLSGSEKAVLYLFLKSQSKSRELPNFEGTVLHLEQNGVLYRPFVTSNIKKEETFILNDWAWEYLNKHLKELGIKLK
jgi:hypothetical protein